MRREQDAFRGDSTADLGIVATERTGCEPLEDEQEERERTDAAERDCLFGGDAVDALLVDDFEPRVEIDSF